MENKTYLSPQTLCLMMVQESCLCQSTGNVADNSKLESLSEETYLW